MTSAAWQRSVNRLRTAVTGMLEKATYGFVESTNAQLIELFEAWRQDIDSEPFAHESEWAGIDAAPFRTVPTWAHADYSAPPRAFPESTPGVM